MLPGCHDQPGGQQACPLPAPRPSQVRHPLNVSCTGTCVNSSIFLSEISGQLFTFGVKGMTNLIIDRIICALYTEKSEIQQRTQPELQWEKCLKVI